MEKKKEETLKSVVTKKSLSAGTILAMDGQEITVQTIRIESDALRLRQGAGIEYAIVGYVFRGEEYNVLDRKDGWYKIQTKEAVGYINGEYIKVVTIANR
ncbi:SH3 domain-containing protein [Microbacteriaceae bacterium 4G12]